MRTMIARGGTLLAAAVLLPACAVRQIREAQDAFNEAARQENRDRFAGNALANASTVAANYRLALAALNRELKENEGALKADNLLGTALVLKALSLWRIADLEDDARAGDELGDLLPRIRTLAGDGTIQLGTRDRVLVEALAGLRDHDLGLRKTTYADAKKFFASAIKGLGDSLATVKPPEGHSVRVYVMLAQLSSYIAWKDAVYRFIKVPAEQTATMGPLNSEFDALALQLKPFWPSQPSLHDLVKKLCLAMGRPAPAF